MKKNILIKCTAFLSALITANMVIPSFSSAAEIDLTADAQLEYAENILDTYLSSYDVNENEIYLSTAYNVYDMESGNETNDVYVVFEDDSVIGMLNVAEVNGEYYSSFEFNNFDTLQEIYDNNEPFSFICSNEQLYINEKSEIYSVEDANITAECKFSLISEVRTELEKEYKVEVSDVQAYANVYSYQKNLPVPIVQNTSIDGKGLCWAAAIASRNDYLHGGTATATDVYYILKGIYNAVPIGIPLWINRGYQYYGIPCTTFYRMVDCVEIFNNIENNNPIHIEGFDNNVGHSVLVSGITINNDGSGVYRLVDSNRMSYIDVAVSESTMIGESNFVYATGYGYTFTDWTRSYY